MFGAIKYTFRRMFYRFLKCLGCVLSTFLISVRKKQENDGLLATSTKKSQYSLVFEGFTKLNPCNGALFQLEMTTFLCVLDDFDPGKVESQGPNNKGADLPGHGFA